MVLLSNIYALQFYLAYNIIFEHTGVEPGHVRDVVDGLNNFEKLYTHVNGKIEIFWIKGLCSSDVNSHLKPYIRLQSIRITPKVFKYALRKNSVIYQVEY